METVPSTWRRLKDSSSAAYCLALVTCVGLIVARNPPAIMRPELWAEDATDFFFTALTHRAASLITPVYGYHFFLCRLVAFAATLLPVLWTPYLYSLFCLTVAAFTSSYFSREGFSWIVPSRWARVFVCGLLAIGPGTGEVFFSLCNSASVLTFLALLLLIEKPFRLGALRFAALAILLVSAGQTFLLAPVVALLWYLTRDRRYGLFLLCFVPIIVVNTIGNHYAAGEAHLLNYGNARLIPKTMVENAVMRVAYMPILGDSLTSKVMTHGWVFWGGALVAGAVGGFLAFRKALIRRELVWTLATAYLCTIAVFGVVLIARSYAVGLSDRAAGHTLWGYRYAYLSGMVALVIWCTVLFAYFDFRKQKLKTLAACVGLVLLPWHNFNQWPVYQRADIHWPEGAAVLQKILDEKKSGRLHEPAVVNGITWVHPIGWGPNSGKLEVTIPPD